MPASTVSGHEKPPFPFYELIVRGTDGSALTRFRFRFRFRFRCRSFAWFLDYHSVKSASSLVANSDSPGIRKDDCGAGVNRKGPPASSACSSPGDVFSPGRSPGAAGPRIRSNCRQKPRNRLSPARSATPVNSSNPAKIRVESVAELTTHLGSARRISPRSRFMSFLIFFLRSR